MFIECKKCVEVSIYVMSWKVRTQVVRFDHDHLRYISLLYECIYAWLADERYGLFQAFQEMYYGESKSNGNLVITWRKIQSTACSIPQIEAYNSLRRMLLLNIVSASLNSNSLSFYKGMYTRLVKLRWLVFKPCFHCSLHLIIIHSIDCLFDSGS